MHCFLVGDSGSNYINVC